MSRVRFFLLMLRAILKDNVREGKGDRETALAIRELTELLEGLK